MTDYFSFVSPGDILGLASGGTYTGVSAAMALLGGSAARPTKIKGNGATISGGNYGILLNGKSYIDVENLNCNDQLIQSINLENCSYVNFDNVSAQSDVAADFNDTWKIKTSSHLTFDDCTAGPSTGAATCDGFELWGPLDDVVYNRCVAHGFNNGPTTNDGHGFETYGQDAGQECTNVVYNDCEAYDCRVGFSTEGGPGANAHGVQAINCNGHDNIEYDAQGIDGSTLYVTVGTLTSRNGSVTEL